MRRRRGGGIGGGGGGGGGDRGWDLAAIVSEVVRAGRFVSGAICALWIRLTTNPYSAVEDSWNKKHNYNGVNGVGNNEYGDYFTFLMGT